MYAYVDSGLTCSAILAAAPVLSSLRVCLQTGIHEQMIKDKVRTRSYRFASMSLSICTAHMGASA